MAPSATQGGCHGTTADNGTREARRAGGCRLQESEQGSSIEVDGLAQVQDVFAVLQAGRIDYEVADLVSCAYQG